jgi:hypothetical protein
VGQILLFLKHWRKSWTSGNPHTNHSLLGSVSGRHRVAHIPGRHYSISHMEACWFASLRIFLGCIGSHLEVDNDFVLPIQRDHDSYIMDLVLESDNFTTKEILQINYCRLFLQSVTLSDLTLAEGTQLDPHMRIRRPSPRSSTTTVHHINQASPDEAAWRLWQRANLVWATPGLLTSHLSENAIRHAPRKHWRQIIS